MAKLGSIRLGGVVFPSLPTPLGVPLLALVSYVLCFRLATLRCPQEVEFSPISKTQEK